LRTHGPHHRHKITKSGHLNKKNRHLDLKNHCNFLNHLRGSSDKIHTCWPRFTFMQWASSSKS